MGMSKLSLGMGMPENAEPGHSQGNEEYSDEDTNIERRWEGKPHRAAGLMNAYY
jgi:hypothetical protein